MLTIAETDHAPTTTIDPAVDLRALEPGDRESLLEIFAGLGSRSRQRRFLTAKPRLTEGELRQLTAVDAYDHVALVAVSTNDRRPIGVARFVREQDRPDSADVAVAVVDAWHDRGIGTLLVRALVQRAKAVGVRRFTLVTHRDNRAALRLLHGSGSAARLVDADSETVEFEVDLRHVG